MINLEDNLRQHEVTEALELDSIEWFREEIGELQLRHAAIPTPPKLYMRNFPPRFGEECQD